MSFCFKTLHELAREATETPATALKMLLVDSHSTGVKHKQPAANASAWLPHITAETRSSCQQWISAPYLGLQIFPNVLYVEMRFQTKTFNTLCDNYHKSVPVQLSLSTFFRQCQSSFDEKFSSYSLLCQRKPRSIIHRRTVAPCLTREGSRHGQVTHGPKPSYKDTKHLCYPFGVLSWFYLTLDTV